MRGARGDPVKTSPSDMAEMIAFHFLPTRYMDSTWWESDGLPDKLYQRLRQSPRSHRHLSRFFLKRAAPVDSLVVDPGRPRPGSCSCPDRGSRDWHFWLA